MGPIKKKSRAGTPGTGPRRFRQIVDGRGDGGQTGDLSEPRLRPRTNPSRGSGIGLSRGVRALQVLPLWTFLTSPRGSVPTAGLYGACRSDATERSTGQMPLQLLVSLLKGARNFHTPTIPREVAKLPSRCSSHNGREIHRVRGASLASDVVGLGLGDFAETFHGACCIVQRGKCCVLQRMRHAASYTHLVRTGYQLWGVARRLRGSIRKIACQASATPDA